MRVLAAPVMSSSKDILAPCVVNGQEVYLLVDSGSRVSALSSTFVASRSLPAFKSSVQCVGVSGDKFSSLGIVTVNVHFGTTLHSNVPFHILKLSKEILGKAVGILGVDLFPQFGVAIKGIPYSFRDPAELMELEDPLFYDPREYHRSTWLQKHQAPADVRQTLLQAIEPLVAINVALSPSQFCTHPSAMLHLDTGNAPPTFVAQYPLPHSVVPFVDKQVAKWFESGTITDAPVDSPYNSPLVAPHTRADKAKGKSPRTCLDPRHINSSLASDPRPIPLASDIFTKIQGFKYISELDLAKSFNQILINPTDRIKTTFTWKHHRYMFVSCPFGLKPLSQLFQSIMRNILYDCPDFSAIFIDNIYVFSMTLEDHIQHVSKILRLLNKFHLRVNRDKCHFGYIACVVLGTVITSSARYPDPHKSLLLQEWKTPVTGKEIERFLGFVNFLRDFIPLYATLAAPLERLRKYKKLQSHWTAQCQLSFDSFKKILLSPVVLRTPLPDLPFCIAVDASQHGLGLVLYQEEKSSPARVSDSSATSTTIDKSKLRYILFAAKALSGAQKKLSSYSPRAVGYSLVPQSLPSIHLWPSFYLVY